VVTHWCIPRMWAGATVAVMASGPSMTQEAADRVRAAGMPTIVVNNTMRLAPWADVLYAADATWWQNTPGSFEFAGLKVSCEPVAGARRLLNAGTVGYTDDPMAVYTYGNSGAQAIQIAAKTGAATILLLGFDMNGGHWHPEHRAPLRSTSLELYAVWRERFPTLAQALRERGVDVINCSPASALECWPRVPLENALARLVPAS
jgi:hypothetical protein